MKVLFCNIAWMEYYKGIYSGIDEPKNGGSFVEEFKDAHEKLNFFPVEVDEFADGTPAGTYCFGFVETKTNPNSVSGNANNLHIERIGGCAGCEKDEKVEDVLVIYCAARPMQNFTSVVGWYKHATVFRKYQPIDLEMDNGEVVEKYYNALAKAEDCVLLPKEKRRRTVWNVPRRQKGARYGFGRANVWYADDDGNVLLDDFMKDIIGKIENYKGENWLYKFPEGI